MTNRIRPTEWEALSAYLDNQISTKDRDRLEARLKQDPEMARALEELRRTRVILRSQPRLRAPRNFSLTPAMAGQRRHGLRLQGSPFATMRLASLLAVVFLVFVTVGDLAVRRYAPEPTVLLSVQTVDTQMGKGGGGGGPGIAPPPPGMEMEAVPAAPVDALAESSEMPDQMALAVTPLSYPPATEEAMAQMVEPGFDGQNAVQPPVVGAVDQTTQTQPVSTATIMIRVLQVILALLAVGAGIVAWMMRRMNV